jgi:transcriptional regulator with XRE-family HTH domain
MAKSNFMDWLKSETARRGIDQKEVDARIAKLMIEDQLIELRRARGISQTRLATLMGVTQPVVARLEAGGVKNLTLNTIARTTAALGGRLQLKIGPAPLRKRSRRRAPRALLA